MCYIEIEEVLKVKDTNYKITLRCYIDVPVEEWTAKCAQLNLETSAKTNNMARENLVKMIEKCV